MWFAQSPPRLFPSQWKSFCSSHFRFDPSLEYPIWNTSNCRPGNPKNLSVAGSRTVTPGSEPGSQGRSQVHREGSPARSPVATGPVVDKIRTLVAENLRRDGINLKKDVSYFSIAVENDVRVVVGYYRIANFRRRNSRFRVFGLLRCAKQY